MMPLLAFYLFLDRAVFFITTLLHGRILGGFSECNLWSQPTMEFLNILKRMKNTSTSLAATTMIIQGSRSGFKSRTRHWDASYHHHVQRSSAPHLVRDHLRGCEAFLSWRSPLICTKFWFL